MTTTGTMRHGTASERQVRGLFLTQGVLATLLGLAILIFPTQTLFALVVFLGAYWFIRGVASLLYIGIERSYWGWKLFVGVLGILAGVLAMTSPLVAGAGIFIAFVYIIGFQALVSGGTEIYYGLEDRRVSLILLGLVSLLLGLALVFNPWIGIAALVILAGVVALVGGLVTIAAALRGGQTTRTATA